MNALTVARNHDIIRYGQNFLSAAPCGSPGSIGESLCLAVEPHIIRYIQSNMQTRRRKKRSKRNGNPNFTLVIPKDFGFPTKGPGPLVDRLRERSIVEICRTCSEVHNPKEAIPIERRKQIRGRNEREDDCMYILERQRSRDNMQRDVRDHHFRGQRHVPGLERPLERNRAA